MPGEAYVTGGISRGVTDIFEESKAAAFAGLRSMIQIGEAAKRRGSTLPLLRRLSTRSVDAEYEAIPMTREGSVSPLPRNVV
jgi:hypothetical protein